MDFLNTMIELFLRYGYLVVFLGVMLENAAIPVPGETILLAAGFFAAQGQLDIVLVISVAIVGAILGDNCGYLLGRKAGRPFLNRYGRWLFLTPAKLDGLQEFFRAHGEKTILVARFIAGLRVVASLLAGISHMHWWRFLAYNAAGAILWATAMGSLGYFFGESWQLLGAWVGRGGLVVLGTVIIGALLIWLGRNTTRMKQTLGAMLPQFLQTREALIILLNLSVLAVFTKVAQVVVRGRATRMDRNLLIALHRFASPELDAAMLVTTFLGSGVVLIPVAALLAVWCYRRGSSREAKAMALGLVASPTLIAILRMGFSRSGPDFWELLANVNDSSFPCGHVANSLVIFGLAAYILGRHYARYRSLCYAGAAILVAAVGFSKIYVGAHWPTDVLAGYSFGSLILFLIIYWYAGNFGLPWRVLSKDVGERKSLHDAEEAVSLHDQTSKRS